MSRQDLELARIHCDGMRELVLNNPAHWKEEPALELMRSLCARAGAVITDAECRAHLGAIEDYAAALGSAVAGRSWTPPALRQREILRKLQRLAGRLSELEAQGAAPITADEHDARRRERYAKVLATAAASVGGTGRLAVLLAVPRADLERWIARAETAPLHVFLAALDCVASGPLTSGSRRISVAALRRAEAPAPAAPKPARRTVLAWSSSATFGVITATATILVTAASALYLAHSARRDAPPIAVHAAPAEPGATMPARVSASARPLPPRARHVALQVAAAPKPALKQPATDPCASLNAWSSLWCREQARLEYCEHREGLEPECPSAIPVSPPQ